MKSFFMLLILHGFLIGIVPAFAYTEPGVAHDVHILQNATPAQCAAAKNGRTGPADATTYSRFGENSGMSEPGIRSCTGCAVDPASKDCVCNVCYYYYN